MGGTEESEAARMLDFDNFRTCDKSCGLHVSQTRRADISSSVGRMPQSILGLSSIPFSESVCLNFQIHCSILLELATLSDAPRGVRDHLTLTTASQRVLHMPHATRAVHNPKTIVVVLCILSQPYTVSWVGLTNRAHLQLYKFHNLYEARNKLRSNLIQVESRCTADETIYLN